MLYRDLKSISLDDYLPPRVEINCVLCKRRADLKKAPLRETYGNVTMGELAHRVAGAGGCPHQPTFCSAFPSEPSVEYWATLWHAWQGQWRCFLTCARHHEGLKRAEPCQGTVELHVSNLKAAFDWSIRLDRLRMKLHCPWCGSRSISLQWVPPVFTEPAKEPGPRELASYERIKRVS